VAKVLHISMQSLIGTVVRGSRRKFEKGGMGDYGFPTITELSELRPAHKPKRCKKSLPEVTPPFPPPSEGEGQGGGAKRTRGEVL